MECGTRGTPMKVSSCGRFASNALFRKLLCDPREAVKVMYNSKNVGNCKKMGHIPFTIKPSLDNCKLLSLNNAVRSPVECVKYLGVTLKRRLTWDQSHAHLASKSLWAC